MKTRLPFALLGLFASFTIYAQDIVFIEINNTSFQPAVLSSQDVSDVDGDGDLDILFVGGGGSVRVGALHLNDGNGNFTLDTSADFEGVILPHITFADINGDEAEDVMITGQDGDFDRIAKLYLNDGDGSFTELPNPPFPGVDASFQAFADVDNDGDLDVLLTGQLGGGNYIANLYFNDGNGNFSLVPNTSFPPVRFGNVLFEDIDNDGDLDVFVKGCSISTGQISQLFTNDGSGNFTLVTNTPFYDSCSGGTQFSDVDNDGDIDLLITGFDFPAITTTELYLNDGGGSFSSAVSTSIANIAVSQHSVMFGDVDNDGDEDLFIGGRDDINRKAVLYANDGNGSFSEVLNTPFDGFQQGASTFADFNNDGYLDIVTTGINNNNDRIAKLFINQIPLGTSNFRVNEAMLYPNPTSEVLHLNNLEIDNISAIEIYDIGGRLVERMSSPNTSNSSIKLKGSIGLYLVKIISENQISQTFKVLKN